MSDQGKCIHCNGAGHRDAGAAGMRMCMMCDGTGRNNPVVGHKTFYDDKGGHRHEPLRESEAKAILAACDAAKAKRAADMPTAQDAARAMADAFQRLRELGWKETCYAQTNERVQLIEAGSGGIHVGSRHEPWPEKTWWIESHGDLWPSMPVLFKPISEPDA